MKVTLEFNLPEEQKEFGITSNAYNFALVIHKLSEYLRKSVKYDGKPFAEVRDKLILLKEEHDITQTFEEL